MADDIANLGSYDIFPLVPNWAKSPTTSYTMVRRLLQYRGGSQQLISQIDDVPMVVEAGFTVYDREDEYDMIDFFNTVMGKVGAFWLMHPKEAFTLNAQAESGASAFPCYPNESSKQYQGHERVYMYLSNGDLITRKITSAVNAGVGTVNLNFDTPIGVDIPTDGYTQAGRLLLVRFDDDKLTLKCNTDTVFDMSIIFQELSFESANA